MTASNNFSDLSNTGYTDAILKLNSAGIMAGSNGSVRPDDNITRQEACIMLVSCLQMLCTITAETTVEVEEENATYILSTITVYCGDALAEIEAIEDEDEKAEALKDGILSVYDVNQQKMSLQKSNYMLKITVISTLWWTIP